MSTATGDPFAGQTATLLDNTGQIRDQTSLVLQQNGDYVLATTPNPGTSFICFTGGTNILTPVGERPVEGLCVGDEVITKDLGAQTIRWIGQRNFAGLGPAHRDMQPIVIKAHAFGKNIPHCDTQLSPNHCVLNSHWKSSIYFGESEVLTAAKGLLQGDYAYRQPAATVSYFHILLDQHSLIQANGMWSESLFLGSECMAMLTPQGRAEISDVFAQIGGTLESYGKRARHMLKPKEARLLI